MTLESRKAEDLLKQYGYASCFLMTGGETQPDREPEAVLLCSESGEGLEEMLRKAAEWKRPVAIVTGNGLRMAMQRILGTEEERCRYTPESLDRLCASVGYTLVDSVPGEEEAWSGDESLLARELCAAVRESGRTLIRLYIPESGHGKNPFLSVIVRTMGKRKAELQEALLSLLAQEDQDFEIILVMHRIPEADEAALRAMVDAQTDFLRQRIRLMKVERPGRCAPINEALKQCRGLYFSVFDDDDFLFPGWTANFRKAWERKPGAILHQYAVGQEWEHDRGCVRAVSGLDNQFCRPYDAMLQARANSCPLMTLAFPTRLWRLGHFFDETLDVCEDWEYLMRTAAFLGVEDEPSVGALYRMWRNAENSHAAHDEEYWRETEERIRDMHNAQPLIREPGAVREFVNLDRLLEEKLYVMESRLYMDTGSGFSEEHAVGSRIGLYLEDFHFSYDLSSRENIRRLRWDPVPGGTIVLKDLKVRGRFRDGRERELDVTWTNARAFPAFWFFDLPDPQMWFEGTEGIQKLEISGRVQHVFTGSDMTVLRGRVGLTALKHRVRVGIHGFRERIRHS